jgi:hypothetical protein
MIYIYSDILGHCRWDRDLYPCISSVPEETERPGHVAVSEQKHCELLTDLEQNGIEVYRQPKAPGDRWHIRKRLLINWVKRRMKPGDWLFCARQPMPELFLKTVRAVHARGAKIAVSWMFAPGFLTILKEFESSFNQAVHERSREFSSLS